MTQTLIPTLHVCTTCRAGQVLSDSDERPGRIMLDAVAALLDPQAPAVDLQEVVCLSSCDHGCAAAISAPGKWTYLLGRLEPGMAADLLRYAETYAQSGTGTVLPSRRPASLARKIDDMSRLDFQGAPVVEIDADQPLEQVQAPARAAVAEMLTRKSGIEPELASFAARAAQGHIGRAKALARDEVVRSRRNKVLEVPFELHDIGACLNAAQRLVDAAKEESKASAAKVDEQERTELEQALVAQPLQGAVDVHRRKPERIGQHHRGKRQLVGVPVRQAG